MEDFLATPADAIVTVTVNSTGVELFGDFECATRLGYFPVWLVNGSSVDLVKKRRSFNGTYTEYHPLQVEGNVLSFLSIPATSATNNSIVICAAISTANHTIDAYSDSVHLTVFQGA